MSARRSAGWLSWKKFEDAAKTLISWKNLGYPLMVIFDRERVLGDT